MLQNYLACGDNASEALDFYSLNAYSWCGDSGFKQSGKFHQDSCEQQRTNGASFKRHLAFYPDCAMHWRFYEG
jgi:hypothetical protein